MSLTQLLVPTYRQMLRSLSGWLEKAQIQTGKNASETLPAARLAGDMFPLSTQVRFACLQAQEAVFRLRSEPFPERLNSLIQEGRNANEQPGSIAEAKARIDEALAFLEGLEPDALDDAAQTTIAIELPNGMIFDMTGEQYARDWAIPQFYFHLMTAYAILRRQKIELGKGDYVQHAFGYLRPGTMPTA